MPFTLCRKQFPVTGAFAMTINKSQGQGFDHVGLYMGKPVFSHGQLYVALSRSKHPENIRICTDTGEPFDKLTNVVYKKFFYQLQWNKFEMEIHNSNVWKGTR